MLFLRPQVFLFYQWDSLLLEAGLLAVVLAPWLPAGGGRRAADPVGLWLVRWLLFRQVFSTGVVKLASQCPSWWSLTGESVQRDWGRAASVAWWGAGNTVVSRNGDDH